MQSSNIEKATELMAQYETQQERDAFADGYQHAHGIACHNVPTKGETYFTDTSGRVTIETVEDAETVHAELCYDAESNARCYSPWEYTAKRINDLGDDAEAAWEAYEAGVSAAIEHDLEGYDHESYGFDDEEEQVQ